MSEETLPADVVEKALELVDWPGAVTDIRAIEDGVNDLFIVSTTVDEPNPVVCKFATFSVPQSFAAGVRSARLLRAHTDLPVPAVYTFRPDPPDMPAFMIREYCPGEPLPSRTAPENPGPARALGNVIAKLGALPSTATAGYGQIQTQKLPETERKHQNPIIAAEPAMPVSGQYDEFTEWLLDYTAHIPHPERATSEYEESKLDFVPSCC